MRAPAVPGGPLQPAGVHASTSIGAAFAPESYTTFTSASGERQTKQWSEAPVVSWLPPTWRLGGRLAFVDWSDIAADLSGGDMGVEVRVGLPEAAGRVPFALAAGIRTNDGLPLGPSASGQDEQWLRLEVYPHLSTRGEKRMNLVTALGASRGARYYDLPAIERFVGALAHFEGEDPEPEDPETEDIAGDLKAFLRGEVRVEATLGAHFRKGRVFFTGVAFWHWVVATGNTYVVDCACDQEWRLDDFSQRSSLTLFGSMGVYLPFSAGEAAGEQAKR